MTHYGLNLSISTHGIHSQTMSRAACSGAEQSVVKHSGAERSRVERCGASGWSSEWSVFPNASIWTLLTQSGMALQSGVIEIGGGALRSERVRERSTAEHKSVQISALWVRSVQIDALGGKEITHSLARSLRSAPLRSVPLPSAPLRSAPLCCAPLR